MQPFAHTANPLLEHNVFERFVFLVLPSANPYVALSGVALMQKFAHVKSFSVDKFITSNKLFWAQMEQTLTDGSVAHQYMMLSFIMVLIHNDRYGNVTF